MNLYKFCFKIYYSVYLAYITKTRYLGFREVELFSSSVPHMIIQRRGLSDPSLHPVCHLLQTAGITVVVFLQSPPQSILTYTLHYFPVTVIITVPFSYKMRSKLQWWESLFYTLTQQHPLLHNTHITPTPSLQQHYTHTTSRRIQSKFTLPKQ